MVWKAPEIPFAAMKPILDQAIGSSLGFFSCFPFVVRKRESPPINPPTYPPPLPSTRVDISERPLSQQPAECTLLRLPPELREYIYEHALGGRLISLFASRAHRGHNIVRSTYYELPDDLYSGLIRIALAPTDRIFIALLLSCRQVYLEALPIMHRRNTFHFLVHEFEVIVLSALGGYCLADIQSVYLSHNYRTMYVPPWATVFPLLHRMRLRDLTFEFDFRRLEWTEITPQRDVFNTAWGRSVLGVRNLRAFGLFFKNGDPLEYPVYRTNIAERFRQLMVEPGADERYWDFLEDRI